MPGSEELSFKEMCARFDVTPRTLRYYEYIELLQPRKDGRSRFYSSREVARMTLILRGRRFGFALEDLRQWLLIYEKQGSKPQFDNRGGKPNGGKRFDKPRDDWREHRPREDRKPAAIDPNSPWAALAALRNPKTE